MPDSWSGANLAQNQNLVRLDQAGRGAARHSKILDTDRAWDVFVDALERNYFERQAPSPASEIPKTYAGALRHAGVLPSGRMAYPGEGARRNAHGNIGPGQIVQVLSHFRAFDETGYAANRRDGTAPKHGFFIGGHGRAGHLHPGVWRRTSSGVTPVLLFGEEAKYVPRFVSHDIVRKAAASGFVRHFRQAMRRALATARR